MDSEKSAVALPADVPAEALPVLQEMGYLEPDRIGVGDRVRPLTLESLHGGDSVTVGAPDAARPTVLIFGSYT
jgi:hypothetical protein